MLISSVPELLTELKKLELNRTHAHKRYWFRGQPAGFELKPRVYRPEFGAFIKEEDRFEKEKHLNQDFKVLSAGLRTGRETDADLYFLQQHYRMPTRLLDWTSNPLAGLYFACGGDENSDGELFLIDAYSALSPKSKIMTSRDPIFTAAIKALVEWKKATCLPKSILAVRPDYFDSSSTVRFTK
jgi:FRG domain